MGLSWLMFWFLIFFNTRGFWSCCISSLMLTSNISSRVWYFRSVCSKLFHFVISLNYFFLIQLILSYSFISLQKTEPVFWNPSISYRHQPSITTTNPFGYLFRCVTSSVSAPHLHISLIIIITWCLNSMFFIHCPQSLGLLSQLSF